MSENVRKYRVVQQDLEFYVFVGGKTESLRSGKKNGKNYVERCPDVSHYNRKAYSL
ncbi:5433_t:CDS:2, partial [Dentiscutata heterogama]